MPTTFIGLSSTRFGGETKQVECNSSGLKEGAVVVWDSTNAGQLVKAPTGAGGTGVAGVICNAQVSGGTSVGDSVDVQFTGIANVLLDATEAVTVGQRVIVSDTDGSVKAATGDQVDYIGVALITKTAGSANELIPVALNIQYVGDAVP